METATCLEMSSQDGASQNSMDLLVNPIWSVNTAEQIFSSLGVSCWWVAELGRHLWCQPSLLCLRAKATPSVPGRIWCLVLLSSRFLTAVPRPLESPRSRRSACISEVTLSQSLSSCSNVVQFKFLLEYLELWYPVIPFLHPASVLPGM